jgi:hypothetical protein
MLNHRLIQHTHDNRLLWGHDENVGVGLVGSADVVIRGADRLMDFIQGLICMICVHHKIMDQRSRDNLW